MIKRLLLLHLFLFAGPVLAGDLEELLALSEEPAGVVIELIEGDEADILDLVPQVQDIAKQLRARFPGISIAVVSHGTEQFALTRKNQQKFAKAHTGIKQIVSDDIDFHVCGTHASWFNVDPEDYPDYIDVTPAGPAQINDYVKLGYRLLKL